MRKTILISGICAACAIASFIVTMAAPPTRKSQPPADLAISEQDWSRACAMDPSFPDESRRMKESVEAAREKLAELLDDTTASDEAILSQVETVILLHDQLERRVTQHLLKIRHQLTSDQQRKLMGLASESVRQGGHRWRGGRGSTTAPATQEDDHPGRKRRQNR